MPRPKKWRRVEFIPNEICFAPAGRSLGDLNEEILKVEEIEAIRLKDIINLNQDECAEKMQVSRQTFQRILSEARTKIARSIIEGKALRIQGGDYTRHVCLVACPKCEHQWEDSYENVGEDREKCCPFCGSREIRCCNRPVTSFCPKGCRKKSY